MKVILDINDNKADFILDWLKQYTYVKIKPMKRSKEELLKDIKNALSEVELIESGQKEGKLLKDFLDEL